MVKRLSCELDGAGFADDDYSDFARILELIFNAKHAALTALFSIENELSIDCAGPRTGCFIPPRGLVVRPQHVPPTLYHPTLPVEESRRYRPRTVTTT